ncbi:MAG: quinolinate synthase NadA, partial [Ruminococcus sp.]|nr:quinolinate synthase NadA [Ruminococcus sp.]
FIGSTAEIIDYVKNCNADKFIICTEKGVEYKLLCDNTDKRFFFPEPCPCCVDMKLNTLKNILNVLKTESNEIVVDKEVSRKAIIPLNKMLEIAR